MAEKPTTVTVTARQYHTLHGEEHQVGEKYAVDAADVSNLVAQGLVDAPAAPAAAPKASQPVEPMTTETKKAKK